MANTFYINGLTVGAQVYGETGEAGLLGAAALVAVANTDTTSINGSTSIDLGVSGYGNHAVVYDGKRNIGAAGARDFSGNIRVKLGQLAATQNIFSWGSMRSTIGFNSLQLYVDTTNIMRLYMSDGTGNLIFDNQSIAALNITTTTWYDFAYTWDNTNRRITIYQDGVTLSSQVSAMRYFGFQDNFTITSIAEIMLGVTRAGIACNIRIDEIVLWDTLKSGASIAAFFTGAARSSYYSFVSTTSQYTDPGASNVLSGTGYTFDGVSYTGTYHNPLYTDPGVANVLSGTSYIFNDTTLTGTYHDPTYSDPGVSNVASGVSYIYNDTTLTGTLAAGGTYTDPGIANVANGTNYIFNDNTLTGTLSTPIASTGTAGTTPLREIKEQIQYILEVNNTTTGAPAFDLSSNLPSGRRVKGIMKVNPEKILDAANDNMLPCVTIFTSDKSPTPADISVNQLSGKRKAEITFKIMGLVYEPFTTDLNKDPADEEIEVLMENVEKIIRSYDTFSNNVKWHFPTLVTYHSLGFDEQAHFRAGVLDLKCILYY